MLYFVYILQASDGTYYVGHTQNLDDRPRRHQQGRSLATKSRTGWHVVHTEEFGTRPGVNSYSQIGTPIVEVSYSTALAA